MASPSPKAIETTAEETFGFERNTTQSNFMQALTPVKAATKLGGVTPSTVNTNQMYRDEISRLSSMSFDEESTDGDSLVNAGDASYEDEAEFSSPGPPKVTLQFDVNSPSDDIIGVGHGHGHGAINTDVIEANHLGIDIEGVIQSHRHQLLEEGLEFMGAGLPLDDEIMTDNNFKNDDYTQDENQSDSESRIKEEAEAKYKAQQQSIIESQREELKRYNDILKTYRNSIREKNDCLKNMEKQMEELKQNPTEAQNENKKDDPNVSRETIGNSSWEAETLSAMKSEIRTYQQIIASLTDENNAFRQKEILLLKKVEKLKWELVDPKRPNQQALREAQDALRHNTEIAESLAKKLDALEEKETENQIQIAELGQGILRSERIVGELEKENETLQKLLTTSREAVLNRSMDNCKLDVSTNDSQLDNSFNMNTSFRSSSDEDGNTIVQESLRKQLAQSKNREAKLRQQLKELCRSDDQKDNIMESLSESQQEAIVYLSGEVDELRSQIEEERKKFRMKLDSMGHVHGKLEVLEQENKLATAEAIAKGKLLESAKQDLSMKNGENTCLRDEVTELAEKSGRAHAMEAALRNLELEHEELKKAYNLAQSQVQSLSEAQAQLQARQLPSPYNTPSRRIPSSPYRTSVLDLEINSQMGETLMTIDVDQDEGNANVENETDTSTAKRSTLDDDVYHRKFTVLKKALKQSYEKKLKDLKSELEEKETEVGKLTANLKEQHDAFQKQQTELKEMQINRIYHESETSQELENLRKSIKDRDDKVDNLRQAMHQINLNEKEDGSRRLTSGLTDISDALIDGVGKSIEIFENMSFHNDASKDMCSSGENNPGANILSSKSFG